ncbi:homeobox protein unc-4 homolog [Poecilia reticulata]|uniref:homeobox protein unc-4 homolog n=1 Tax=Poecilia reticulata TaxID=8081 RepID=UPI0007EAA67C|nr:PREDICTED: homeobox protein unc-4 homolog [Poecilia reticulata]
MDSRVLEHPHAQFGGSLGGLVGFPYSLGSHHHHHHHQHVYELASGHQLQSAAAVPFSIDGLLNGSCSASVVTSSPLLSSDSQQFKLSGESTCFFYCLFWFFYFFFYLWVRALFAAVAGHKRSSLLFGEHAAVSAPRGRAARAGRRVEAPCLGSVKEEVWFQNRRAKWRKKENTKKGPGRPAHNSHPTTCSGEPMDPEEIARRERERAEKKKRKQERKLLKSQNKLLSGDSFHTPGGSESDSGVSQFTDSEQQPPPPSIHVELPASRGESSCDQTRHDFGPPQNQLNQRTMGEPEQVSPDSTHGPGPGGQRSPGMQKRNPFSVESLLSDTMPRRKSQLDFSSLPNQRTLVGKGHFLLYPITHQPLGFLVPQAALKAAPCQENPDRLAQGQRRSPSEGSPAPSDLSTFGSTTDRLNSAHTEHTHHNHLGVTAEADDARDRVSSCKKVAFPVPPPSNGADQTVPVGEDGGPAARTKVEQSSKERSAREEPGSPGLGEANTDCGETPGTDGEDVDMD